MVDGNPLIMWEFLGRIRIRRAYFHPKGRWTFVGMGEGGLKGRGGLSIIPLHLKYCDYRLDVPRRILLGKKCICDIGEKGGKYGSRMYY